ncbi:hypothetical protein F4778DRAFT_713754 [Xylariomycetidae sp. FL2044]|nr:hypothetical protein F4778DRAFT_713754 [Xylariomycetidae sp. FL2044]
MASRTILHPARLRALTAPRIPHCSTFRAPTPPTRTWARLASSSSSSSASEPTGSKPPSPNAQFYKTFGRPIAKVFLMAIFTYQLAYYFWARLEHDEIKDEKRATISDLEARIEQLEKARKR